MAIETCASDPMVRAIPAPATSSTGDPKHRHKAIMSRRLQKAGGASLAAFLKRCLQGRARWQSRVVDWFEGSWRDQDAEEQPHLRRGLNATEPPWRSDNHSDESHRRGNIRGCGNEVERSPRPVEGLARAAIGGWRGEAHPAELVYLPSLGSESVPSLDSNRFKRVPFGPLLRRYRSEMQAGSPTGRLLLWHERAGHGRHPGAAATLAGHAG